MGSLDSIFSEDNMIGYAGACVDLAVSIPERRTRKGFDTLVIPSRGAVPFFLGMAYALQDLSLISTEHQEFYTNLGVQGMFAPLLREDSQIARSVNERPIKVMLVPFTADLNIERFDPKESSLEYMQKTRNYWANVTASFFEEPQERKNDPYFRSFVDILLRDIEGRGHLAEKYESFPKISGFALMDTVISGRASNDILKSFDELASSRNKWRLMPDAFLVVDANGSKLRRGFMTYLNRKKVSGTVETYPIPRIVSEDEGASLLGVSAVVYPSIMRASKGLSANGRDFFVGAGSWRLACELIGEGVSPYRKHFDKFMDVVYKAIATKLSREYMGVKGNEEMEQFRAARQDFVEYAEKNKILNVGDPDISVLKLRRVCEPEGPYETSSHVVHIPFSTEGTQRSVSKLCAIPQVNYKGN